MSTSYLYHYHTQGTAGFHLKNTIVAPGNMPKQLKWKRNSDFSPQTFPCIVRKATRVGTGEPVC